MTNNAVHQGCDQAESHEGIDPAPLPLPDHLRGRLVSYWADSGNMIVVDVRDRPLQPLGMVEHWWPWLSPQQQYGLFVASITDYRDRVKRLQINEHVSLHHTGEITLAKVPQQVATLAKQQAALAAAGNTDKENKF